MNDAPGVLGAIHPALASIHGLPLFIFWLVIALTLAFFVGYIWKAPQVFSQLGTACRELAALRKKGAGQPPEEVGRIFRGEPLKHLWEEYADALHPMHRGGSGAEQVFEVRATAPAEAFFTREVLVDSRLFDEFTRHLPGILTGLGIIGTFAGLLEGLSNFKPTDVDKAVVGLGQLMAGVEHAFIASGLAIFCAMLVVSVSRLLLAILYRRVEQLNHLIDNMYSTGAAEEYLARLVKSTQESAASTAQLKDALVEDLRQLMTNLVDRQIAAQQSSTNDLAKVIGETISTSIAEPMKKVGEAMEITARGNGEQVGTMLQTLLTGFMAKLEDTFGGQMRGINEQMQKSMDAMAAVQASLQGLLADIKRTNEQAANRISGTLEEAMKKAADNQQLLTDQMREFVQDFRRLVTEEQSKSKQAMDEAVSKVLGEVVTAMSALEATRKAAATEETGRNERLADQTKQLVGGLTSQVDELLQSVSAQVAKTQQNVEALGAVSLRAIEGMNQGALTMGSAAQRFETAGTSVTGVLQRSTQVTDQLASAASTLQAAATAVQRGFEQYDSTRRTVDTQVAALMGLIESAKQEAGVSEELVKNMRLSAEAMRRAEGESREYLEQVNAVLVKAFQDFGTALSSQIKSATSSADTYVGNGIGRLTGVVQEFEALLQRMRRS
jgi:hypothetical protein